MMGVEVCSTRCCKITATLSKLRRRRTLRLCEASGMAAPADRLLADKDGIDAIARGLVREYLLRKGMRSVLDSFDAEAVRFGEISCLLDA